MNKEKKFNQLTLNKLTTAQAKELTRESNFLREVIDCDLQRIIFSSKELKDKLVRFNKLLELQIKANKNEG